MESLQSGPFQIGYTDGFLFHFRVGETEILRRIYFALRDENWSTIPYTITGEKFEKGNQSFEASFRCVHHLNGKNIIDWKCSIAGTPAGKVTFTIDGQILEPFKKNRVGFCILHPLESTLGSPVEVIHPDGSKDQSEFPRLIAAKNPFRNIRGMRWKSGENWFRIAVEGDIFETEDQRNWSDASFKTFSTPADLPKPVLITKGERIFQRVTIEPEGKIATPSNPASKAVLTDSKNEIRIPRLGLGASTEVKKLSEAHLSLLREINLSFYRIEITPSEQNWVADFSRACEDAAKLNLAIEAVVRLGSNFQSELDSFVGLCAQNRIKIQKVLLVSAEENVTSESVINTIPKLKSSMPGVLFGAGTESNFTEINGHRFKVKGFDFVSYTIQPQVHAFDDITLFDNIEGQFHTAKSASEIYGKDTPIHISPVTLKDRSGPDAADPRQVTGLAAAWTFGSICSLAKGGADAVTYFQTVGKQGIVSEEGKPYPVYDVLRVLSRYTGKSVWALESNNPLSVQGIVTTDQRLALANLTPEKQEVSFGSRMITLNPYEVRFE